MGATKWSGEPGTANVIVQWDDLVEEDEENPEELRLLFLENFIKETNKIEVDPEDEFYEVTLEIDFESSGYHDPGVYTALPENCYPEEHDEERSLEKMTLYTCNHGEGIVVNEELAERLFDKYYDEVMEVDIFGG